MSRALARLERLQQALIQARRAAEADMGRAAAQLCELAQRQADLEAALTRQHAFADMLLSPSLSRLAGIGLRIVSGEAELSGLRQCVTELAIKLRLIEARLATARKLDTDRAAREQLAELASRQAWLSSSSLKQAV